MDDARLIKGYLQGESKALFVVDGWLRAAIAPFRRRLGDDAEDVLQQVRLETLRLFRAGSFRGDSSLRTYLCRVACHSSIDAMRRLGRRPPTEGGDLEVSLESPVPSALDALLQRERQRFLVAVLETMSAGCRELWTLILQGHSYRELSERLGISEGALRVRAHRCRKRAAAALDGPSRSTRLELRAGGTGSA